MKARENLNKHNVTFEEAITVFWDTLSSTIADLHHSIDEDRYIIVGKSARGRILVVVHTDRGDKIRIISARIATKRERRIYEEGK
ncbi:MAG: BrnT family toxin [bacterium]